MESNVAMFDGQQCVCTNGGSLAVLKDVQRAYEERLELVERFGGYKKTEMQLDVFRQWVGDLVSQNALLAHAVTELEREATSRLAGERVRHQEREKGVEICGYKDLKTLSDSLQKENSAKDREIRRLVKDMSLYEQTIANLRSEISSNKYQTPDAAKRDESQKDNQISESALVCVCGVREECTGRLRGLERNLKSSSENLRALRRVNVTLSEELHGLRRVCAALDDQCRAAQTRMKFKDEIIREMRRQLKQAKDKHPPASEPSDEGLQNLDSALLKESCYSSKAEVGCQRTAPTSVTCQTLRPILKSFQTSKPSTPRLLKDLTDAVCSSTYHSSKRLLLSEPILSNTEMPGTVGNSLSNKCPPSSSVVSIEEDSQGTDALPTVVCVSRNIRREVSETPDVGECHRSCDVLEEEDSPRPPLVLPADSSIGARVRELYFNRNVKMSDAAVDWKQCMIDVCDQSFDSPKAPADTPIDEQKVICATMHESGASSLNSAGGCDAARAQYYHNKLLATLQILENKEQQCAVQGQSLAVAEARIAALGARATALKDDLDRKAAELRELRKSMSCCSEDKPHTCVAVQTSPQTPEEQEEFIKTLKDHISVIEELYRECFYESAKQDHLINLLRDGAGSQGELGRLRRVVAAQKRSLDQCQDIASEVESLKVEISNFLNSSNNDSGVWEGSAASSPALGSELHDILTQLLELRDLLANDCSCGLEGENKKLKEITETLQIQIGALKERANELEDAVSDRDSTIKQLRKLKQDKEQELEKVRCELRCAQKECCKQRETCDCLQLQLQQTEVLLQERNEELETERRLREECTAEREELQGRLERAEQLEREKTEVRGEVSALRRQVCRWRAQLAASEQRVRSAREHAATLHHTYREKSEAASRLQEELCAAQTRGAQLCARAHALTHSARRWLSDMRVTHREQEEKIKEQQELICELQCRLDNCCGPQSITYPASGQPKPGRSTRRPCLSLCDSDEVREQASCGSTPVPPRRVLKKRIEETPSMRSQSAQRGRAETTSGGRRGTTDALFHTPVSTGEELEDRLEQLQVTLGPARRPWPCCPDHQTP